MHTTTGAVKKSLAILLLVILFYNSIGFIYNFNFILHRWRNGISKVLHSYDKKNDLIVFKFNANEYNSSVYEFIKDGISYDVVKTAREGDCILVYCFSDHFETNLKNLFHINLLENLNLTGETQKNTPRTFNHFFSEFIFDAQDYWLPVFEKSSLPDEFLPHGSNQLVSLFDMEVKTPPPKIQAA